MLTYNYKARDVQTGKVISSTVQAESESAAAKLISKEGLAPIDIKLQGGDGSGLLSNFTNRVRTKDKVLFSRQLSTLINAGLPLAQALRTVAEQARSKQLKLIVNQVIADVEAGRPLSEAFSRHPDTFDNVFISLIAAGETSGTLDQALLRIANQQEKDADIKSKIRGAMVYPAIVLVVITGVIIFMMTTVLPQVEILYNDLNKSLPWYTAGLMFVSRILIRFWYLFIISFFVGIYFLIRYGKTEAGKSTYDSLKLNTPLFGKLFRKMYMARFSRTGQTLMSTGVQMLETLRITSKAVNNVHVEQNVLKAAEKVKGGKALSEGLKDQPYIEPLVPQMIAIGEKSGGIDEMMGKTADYYEKELDAQIKALSTTIEPVLMVVLAAVAAFMVAAILLPVYGLVGQSLAL